MNDKLYELAEFLGIQINHLRKHKEPVINTRMMTLRIRLMALKLIKGNLTIFDIEGDEDIIKRADHLLSRVYFQMQVEILLNGVK